MLHDYCASELHAAHACILLHMQLASSLMQVSRAKGTACGLSCSVHIDICVTLFFHAFYRSVLSIMVQRLHTIQHS